jgi:DNA polymerase-1
MKILLVIDVHFLAHRAYHTTGKLKYKGESTGVAFGFFRTLQTITDEIPVTQIAFCFEGKTLHRRKFYPDYKKRKSIDKEERVSRVLLKKQIEEIRDVLLPDMGFRNIFCVDGYESDDLMAVLSKRQDFDIIYLVTGDHDLFQCLRPGVKIYSPTNRKIYTHEWFFKEYGIYPEQWSEVKALAGCKSDNIKGIPGVGEKTALKIIQIKTIAMEPKGWTNTFAHNMHLIELPWPGCPTPELKSDDYSIMAWKKFCLRMGMATLANNPMLLA